MTSINAATLPGNFIQNINKGLALRTPTPQFWFAAMAMGSRLRSAGLRMGLTGASQYLDIIMGNGAPVAPELQALVRAADAYPGMVIVGEEMGKSEGDSIKLQRPIYSGAGYTEEDRQVVPDKPTSVTGQPIRTEDVTLVLKEFEGPFAVGATRPSPYEIRHFDARFRKNATYVASLVVQNLGYDYTVWKDRVLRNRCASSQYVTYSGGVTTVNSMTAGAGYGINLRLMLEMRRAIRDRNWRPFDNGRYILLVPTVFSTQIPEDYEYRTLSANHGAGRNVIFSPVDSVQDIDIFELSTLRNWGAGETIPGVTGTVQTGVTVHECLMLGPEILGHALGQDPKVEFGTDTDYGKLARVIWRSVEAFQTFDERGIQRGIFQEG